MPPNYVLSVPKSSTLIHLYDLKGSSVKSLFHTLDALMLTETKKCVFLVRPASIHSELASTHTEWEFQLVKSFGGHLSMEDPPDLRSLIQCSRTESTACHEFGWSTGFFEQLYSQISLNIYKVS